MAREPAVAAVDDVDEWGRSEHMCDVFHRAFDPIYRRWFRARWEGLEHIPRSGGALLVANHAGAVPADGPVIMHGIEKEVGRPLYVLADYTFWSLPVAGTVFARMGGVAAHPANAHRLLHDEGCLALVYPEGTKGTGKLMGERYQLRRFGRGGFVEIALRTGSPIVPVAVVGSEEIYPKIGESPLLARAIGAPYFPLTPTFPWLGPLGVVPLPSKWRLEFGQPIPTDEYGPDAAEDRALVFELTERVRDEIQRMVYENLLKRGRAFI